MSFNKACLELVALLNFKETAFRSLVLVLDTIGLNFDESKIFGRVLEAVISVQTYLFLFAFHLFTCDLSGFLVYHDHET